MSEYGALIGMIITALAMLITNVGITMMKWSHIHAHDSKNSKDSSGSSIISGTEKSATEEDVEKKHKELIEPRKDSFSGSSSSDTEKSSTEDDIDHQKEENKGKRRTPIIWFMGKE